MISWARRLVCGLFGHGGDVVRTYGGHGVELTCQRCGQVISAQVSFEPSFVYMHRLAMAKVQIRARRVFTGMGDSVDG